MIYLVMVICSSTKTLTVISVHKVCVKRLGQTPGWSCLVIYIVPEVLLALKLLEISGILSICSVDTSRRCISGPANESVYNEHIQDNLT